MQRPFPTVYSHDEMSLSHQLYSVKHRVSHINARRSPWRLQSPTSHHSLEYSTGSSLGYWSGNLRGCNKLLVLVL